MPHPPASLPSGRVTFAFIDVVGSTRTFIEHGEAYAAALRSLHATVERHAVRCGGVVVETEGDGAFLAFPDASSGVQALTALQDELAQPPAEGLHLRVRAGAHTGHAVPVDGHYLSLAVYVAARVGATANAGQVLVTDEVVDEITSSGARDAEAAVDVGSFALKDITDPVRIWRIAGDDTPPRATPARRTNVQEPRTTFVGRTEELGTLRDLVSTPGLVTMMGPGGTGKTRLASELALRDAESLPGGAWLVELATLEAPDQVVGAVGAALGLHAAPVSELLLELKRRERCLLVLDNCEHLIDPVCDLVEELLGGCPELILLCTTREALNLAGERVWKLPPLPVVSAATELFLERASSASAVEPDPDLVKQLCVALDGLPLAIELAASQAGSAPLQEIVAAVTSGSDPLTRRGGELRQRSLDAVLGWSLDRLTPAARNSLLTLSLFPGRFSPDMGRAVLDAAPSCDPNAMRLLAGASLVDLDGPDYRLLWTIRYAARRRLDEDPRQKREAEDALVAWAASYGEERYRELSVHAEVPEDTVLAVETALGHGLDHGMSGMGRAWHFLYVVTAARGSAESVLALSRRAALDVDPDNPDSALVVTAAINILEQHQVDGGVSPERFQAMKRVARDAGDPRLLVEVYRADAMHESNHGRWDRAAQVWLEALPLAKDHQEARHELPGLLGNLAVCSFYVDDMARSSDYNRQAVAAAAEQGIWHVEAVALSNLAELDLLAGRLTEARDHALASLKVAPPNFASRSYPLAHLARALARLGEHESARVAGRQAKELLDSQLSLHSAYGETLRDLLADLPELATEPD